MFYNMEHYPDPTADTAIHNADIEIRAAKAARMLEERMQEIKFKIPGPAKAKERPRARVMYSHGKPIAQIYTPKNTQGYEANIRACFARQIGDVRLAAPIRATILVIHSVPKSYPKRRREDCLMGAVPHTGKPDLDNIAKVVLDALNGVAYDDDAQVTELLIRKQYGPEPCVWVRLQGDATVEQSRLEKVGGKA